MDDSLLGLLGLCRRAGKLELGEEDSLQAARERRARLVLAASDIAEGPLKKARALETDNCPVLSVPFPMDRLGSAVGRGTCALAAVTEVGFASALVRKLAQADPERYAETSQRLERRAEKAVRRRRAKRQAGKTGGR